MVRFFFCGPSAERRLNWHVGSDLDNSAQSIESYTGWRTRALRMSFYDVAVVAINNRKLKKINAYTLWMFIYIFHIFSVRILVP